MTAASSAESLTDFEFVDLYLCDRFADYKAFAQGTIFRRALPESLIGEARDMLAQCKQRQSAGNSAEFLLNFKTIRLRVTFFAQALGGPLFVLRKISASVRSLKELGVRLPIQKMLLEPELRGLVLIAGEMGQGKTSTAASILIERLQRYGGVSVAIEDPPEAMLDGLHGEGRCVQVIASADTGGYRQQMIYALRSGAGTIMIGEIRDADTAYEAINACINGHLIISTLHGGDICQAIERLNLLCESHSPDAHVILSSGLSLVLWQSLEAGPPGPDNTPSPPRLKMQCLSMTVSARALVRAGKISHLANEVDQQERQRTWQ